MGVGPKRTLQATIPTGTSFADWNNQMNAPLELPVPPTTDPGALWPEQPNQGPYQIENVQWLDDSGQQQDQSGGGGGGGGGGSTSPAFNIQPGQFTMDPFTGAMSLSAFEYHGRPMPGDFSYAPFVSPGAWDAPDDFKAPTIADLQTDPGYQFRQDQGRKALERSAAAKGTLLTGGTLQDITGFADQLASQEFDKLYQRSFGEWKSSYDNSLQQYLLDYNRQFGEHQQGFEEALSGYNTQAQAHAQDFNEQLSGYNANATAARDRYQSEVTGYQLEAGRRQQQFSNLMALAGLAE